MSKFFCRFLTHNNETVFSFVFFSRSMCLNSLMTMPFVCSVLSDLFSVGRHVVCVYDTMHFK